MFTTIIHHSQLITIYSDRGLIPRNRNLHSTPVFAINSTSCYAHGNVCATCNLRDSRDNCRNSITKFLETLQSTHPELLI